MRVRGVIPAKVAAVLQPMTRLEIITPPNDDSLDEQEDFVDIPERVHRVDSAQHDSMEPKCAENVHAASHSYSFLPYWMTQLWRSTAAPPTPCDVIHKRSLFESYFLNEKLSRVLRLQIDTITTTDAGSDQPFSCRISSAALDSQVTTIENAAFFARLMPVPASSAEGDAMTEPLPILVRVSSSEDQLLADRLYLPPAWLRWQGAEVGTPVYLESMRLADGLHKEDSIVEQVAVLRIRNVYPGSLFLSIPDPDHGSRISDPGSNNSNKREGRKKICYRTFFCSHKYHKTVNYVIFELVKKQV